MRTEIKSAVIFDLDGTLVDTPRGIVETFMATLKSMESSAEPSAIRATIGLPLERAFGQLLNLSSEDPKVMRAVKQYQALFKEIVLPKAKELVFGGVTRGLANLQFHGYRLAVATSKVYVSAEALLKAAGLWEYFDLVVGADHVKLPKPHPEMGELVMRKLGVLPENTVMVGDTTHDILMAKGSGMYSIGVTYGIHDFNQLQSADPEYIVDTFDSVLQSIFNLFTLRMAKTA